MNTIELIETAIKTRKPISFNYSKPGKVQGPRIGNPHCIYISSPKDSKPTIQVDVWQTDGVTDTPRGKSKWRDFIVQYITELKVLSSEPDFSTAPGYVPNAHKYKDTLAKI